MPLTAAAEAIIDKAPLGVLCHVVNVGAITLFLKL